METPNIFEAEIKKEIKDAIDFQQQQIEYVIESTKKRNLYLSQKLANYNPIQPFKFPDYPESPPRELIEQFYEARRKSILAQKKRESLLQTQLHLNERINNAKAMLQKEQQEYHNRAVFNFSPTVSRLLNIQPQQTMRNNENNYSINNKLTVVESTLFEEQLEAITALRDNGVTPRQFWEVKYDFDDKMEQIDAKIKKVKSVNDRLLQEITTKVNNFLENSTVLDDELLQRQIDMSSFQYFANAYYNSNNEIEKLKYTKLLKQMKTIRDDVQEKRFNELYNHLNTEKEMIDEQLSALGTGDFETNKLKSEIEFQMLYLGHLTAIAGKALSHISTEKVPPDPVEEMQAEILRMQHILSKSNSA